MLSGIYETQIQVSEDLLNSMEWLAERGISTLLFSEWLI